MGLKYTVELTPEAQDDFMQLDNSQRIHVKKSFVKLENQGLLVGEQLSGSLVGYRKLKHRKLGLRVIFHASPNGITIIEVVAIGKRSDDEVYKVAESRIKKLKR